MDNFVAVKSLGSGSHGLEQSSTVKKHGTKLLEPILELENVMHDPLQVKEEKSESFSDSPSDGGSGLEDDTNRPNFNMDGLSTTSCKCVTFPVPSLSVRKEPEAPPEDNDVCNRSSSIPTDRKLVSCIKGSRQKNGIPLKKLTVTWAPDVYDPSPTSVSHLPKKKSYQQYSKSHKKHGKGKHKGKNVRGGGSGQKEKKHPRKITCRSDWSFDSYAQTNSHNYKSSLEILDFNDPGIGSPDPDPDPDPDCGSKFLEQAKLTSGTMHCVF
ncbi:uncharacterized protein LOC141616796 [Silene latifolia]|uniref:uncharacterized protein LOC141616796 n=1 Tax=Silene latifolia TaxID=37657 RepID=UPI003D76DBB2